MSEEPVLEEKERKYVYIVSKDCSHCQAFPFVRGTKHSVIYVNAYNRETRNSRHGQYYDAFTDRDLAKEHIRLVLTDKIAHLEREIAKGRKLLDEGTPLEIVEPKPMPWRVPLV